MKTSFTLSKLRPKLFIDLAASLFNSLFVSTCKKLLNRAVIAPVMMTAVLITLNACSSDTSSSDTNSSDTNNANEQASAAIYHSGDAEIDQKVEALLSQMTLAEKVGQLNQYNGSWDVTGPVKSGDEYNEQRLLDLRSGGVGSMLNVISVAATSEAQRIAVEETRLGIPLLFAYDVIHGFQTMFPVPLGEAASWDLALMEKSARIAAVEASAAGLHWTFAPMIDIGRDARFGRVMEGAGEDPYFGSKVAVARINGFQGDDLSQPNTIAACAKHFAGYAFAEAGRDYNTVDISNTTLHNVILPPFKAAAEAGVATFMNSFSELDGIPATASGYLQNTLLKGQWDYRGLVVSDWDSIGEMQDHGFSADLSNAASQAINAGNDIDMEATAYIRHLAELVESGAVAESVVDNAVRRVLVLKYRLGLFEDPYRYASVAREQSEIGKAEHLEVARDAARKSIVLLKNDNAILPLSTSGQRIAVIGPLANDKDSPLGNWRARAIPNSAISLLEGVTAAVSDTSLVSYAQGAELATSGRAFHSEITINTDDTSGFAEAIAIAREADVVVMAIGEDAYQSGEARSQVSVKLSGVQQALFDAVSEVNDQVVVVLMNGRPLAITELDNKAAAIVEAWHAGSQAGHGIADVLFGAYNPSGKLPMSFPRHTGQLPLYYSQKNTGRPGPSTDDVFWTHYTDSPNTPLYPFGFGLSYTEFDYSDITLSANSIAVDESLEVSVTLTNSGERDGVEIAQLYIRDLIGSITRPVKELKGFERVALKAGESKKVTFTLGPKTLGFYNTNGEYLVEAGDFEVFVGGNSDASVTATFSATAD